MPAATKKIRPPAELEPGEGKLHESAESAAEEIREGAEPDDAPKGKTNRKRSAKGAKATKAPMDGDCGCGGGKAKKCTCDGGCGGYAKKMDRSDALTPQEYLAACDLGVQGRSRAYIRARLDAAQRLDKKCGASGIADNKKCNVATGSSGHGSSLGNALKVIGAGAALGAAGVAGVAMYQRHQRNMQTAKSAVKKANEVRFKANAGIRAAGLAAQNGVANAREGWEHPEVNRVLTEENAVRSGMQAIQAAKSRRKAAYSDLRQYLSEVKRALPESGARSRSREVGAAARPPTVQRRVRRQGKVVRLSSMYADGFNVDTTLLGV